MATQTCWNGKDGAIAKTGTDYVHGTTSWTISSSADTVECTTMGSTGNFREYKAGLKSWEGSAELVWSDDGNAQALDETFAIGDESTIRCYPDTGDTGIVLNGSIIVTGIEYAVDMEDVMRATLSFTGTGELTVDDTAT